MKKLPLLSFFILSVLLLVSCSKSIVFEEKVVFPNNNWSFDIKSQTFEAPLKSSKKPYAIVLELELTGTPNVKMFYADFIMATPTRGIAKQQVVFNFANPKEPLIQGTSPKEKILRLTVYPKKYLSETGIYSFKVDQFSNNYDNYNIRALRLYIERIKN